MWYTVYTLPPSKTNQASFLLLGGFVGWAVPHFSETSNCRWEASSEVGNCQQNDQNFASLENTGSEAVSVFTPWFVLMPEDTPRDLDRMDNWDHSQLQTLFTA